MPTIPDLLARERPWVIAHRGDSAHHPENTHVAFEAAIEAGADLIELDVALTADRVPVVLHDETVDRTTNGRGRLRALAWAQVMALDAGASFDPRFACEPIPSLEGVLRRHGKRIALNLELKSEAFDRRPRSDALEVQVHALVTDLRLQERVIVSSFDQRFLRRLARMTPRLPCALLYGRWFGRRRARSAAARLGAVAVNPDAARIRENDVRTLADAGLRVLPYTVDEEEAMRRLLAWGVGGLFTNDPARLKAILEEPA